MLIEYMYAHFFTCISCSSQYLAMGWITSPSYHNLHVDYTMQKTAKKESVGAQEEGEEGGGGEVLCVQ